MSKHVSGQYDFVGSLEMYCVETERCVLGKRIYEIIFPLPMVCMYINVQFPIIDIAFSFICFYIICR